MTATNPATGTTLPDHTQLPESDGTLGVELGLWLGVYQNAELPWLRWWDLQGNLLLNGEERAEQESQRAELESQRAELERQRADCLTAQLRRRIRKASRREAACR